MAFGTLIRAEVLDQVPMVNLHFSLLPRWRGAAPVERAILAGDERTGVCLMALEEGLDTGPVYARVEVPILPGETAAELRARLADLGADLLVERLAGGVATLGTPVPQRWRGCSTRPRSTRASCGSTGSVRPSSSTGSCASGAPGRRFGASASSSSAARLVVAGGSSVTGERHRLSAGATGCAGHAARRRGGLWRGRLELLEVRPEGRSVQAFDAWLRGARPAWASGSGT